MENYRLSVFETSQHFNSGDSTEPPIDSDVLLSRCLGNVSFAMALLNELEVTGRRQVEPIIQHARGNQPRLAAAAAHSLKGAAAIIGAKELRLKAAEIEAAGYSDATTSLVNTSLDLQDEMDRCLAYLDVLRNELEQGTDSRNLETST